MNTYIPGAFATQECRCAKNECEHRQEIITGPRDDPNQEESEMEECLDTIEKKNSLRSKAEALLSKAEAEGWYLGPLTPIEDALQEEGQASLKKQLEELKKQLDEL